jgi:hypothetical protein
MILYFNKISFDGEVSVLVTTSDAKPLCVLEMA